MRSNNRTKHNDVMDATRKRNAAQWGRAAQNDDAPTTKLTLPSGFEVEARRPPLTAWLMSGRLPEKFVSEAMTAAGKGAADSKAFDNMEGEDLLAMLTFIRDVVTATLVWPKIVAGADPESENEIDPSRIPEADFYFIFGWAMQGAPDVPVGMKNGEVSVNTLAGFRADEAVRRTGGDGGEVRAATEHLAGA